MQPCRDTGEAFTEPREVRHLGFTDTYLVSKGYMDVAHWVQVLHQGCEVFFVCGVSATSAECSSCSGTVSVHLPQGLLWVWSSSKEIVFV